MKDFLVVIEISDASIDDEIIAYKTLIVKAESEKDVYIIFDNYSIDSNEYEDLEWSISFIKELSSIQVIDNKKDIQAFIEDEKNNIKIENDIDEDYDDIIIDNDSNIIIKDNKVIINGEEIDGVKKYLYLFGAYAVVPLIIIPIILIVLSAIGLVLISTPIIIVCLIIAFISGIIGIFKH
jgi:hypothetical protein